MELFGIQGSSINGKIEQTPTHYEWNENQSTPSARISEKSTQRRLRRESETMQASLFTSESSDTSYTSSTTEIDLTPQFIRDYYLAIEESRFADALAIIEGVEARNLEVSQAFIEGEIAALRSKCYEKIGRLDLALQEMEKEYAKLEDFHLVRLLTDETDMLVARPEIGEMFWNSDDDKNFSFPFRSYFLLMGCIKMPNWEMRRAALLLHAKREREAIDLLQKYPMDMQFGTLNREEIFLRGLIQNKLGVSLFPPQDTDSHWDHAQCLFRAGDFERAEQLFAMETDLDYIDRWDRAICLALLGRLDEAAEFFKDDYGSAYPNHSNNIVGSIILFLNGELKQPPWSIDAEFKNGFPVRLLMQWLVPEKFKDVQTFDPSFQITSENTESENTEEWLSQLPEHRGFQQAFEEDRCQDALDFLEKIQNRRLETAREMIGADWLVYKIDCLQKMGCTNLAAFEAEKIAQKLETRFADPYSPNLYLFEDKHDADLLQAFSEMGHNLAKHYRLFSAALHLDSGNVDQAIGILEKCPFFDSSVEVFIRGLLDRRLGISSFRSNPSISSEQSWEESAYWKGKEAFEKGEFDEAETLFEQCLEENDAKLYLAACFILRDQKEEALKLCESYREDDPWASEEDSQMLSILRYLSGKTEETGLKHSYENAPWELFLKWIKANS